MQIISTTPAQGSSNIGLETEIKVLFDIDIDIESIDGSSITVSTDKVSILTPAGHPFPNTSRYTNDTFFPSGFLGFQEGDVSLNPVNAKELIFKPSFRLDPNTDFTVYVSKAIAGTNATLLDEIFTFKFRTTAEDIVHNLITPIEYSQIIGTYVQFNESETVASTAFRVISTTPKDGSFLNSSNIIKITFSDDITDEDPITQEFLDALKAKISFEYNAVLSDYPPVTMDPLDFDIAVDGKVLTVTIVPGTIENNAAVVLSLDKNISTNKILAENLVLSYITVMDYYYTSTQLVRLKAGTVLGTIKNSHIALMIYLMSSESNLYLKSLKGRIPESDYGFIRSKWVLYKTLEQLLLNNANDSMTDFIKEQFAEYSISISNGNKVKLYNSLLTEIRDFFNSLKAMMNFLANIPMSRGLNNREIRSRSWYSGEQPGLNAKETSTGKMIFDEIGVPIADFGDMSYV